MRVKMKGTHEVFACSANPFTRDGAGKERSCLVKRYCALVLVVFVMLLLLPLPALGVLEGDKSPPAPPPPPGAPSPDTSSPSASDTFRVLDTDSGKVVELSERDFLIGTVANELYPTYHIEAMKAQAVAAYTYYSRKRTAQRANPSADLKGADFSDVPSRFPEGYTTEGLKERWGKNYDTYYKKVCEAVDAVAGKRLYYDGQPIMASYHAISFGATETAGVVWGSDYPYLQSVPSPGDKLSPDYETVVSFKAADFSAALCKEVKDLKLEGDAAGWVTGDPKLSEAGTVEEITVGGMKITGRQMRAALSLRSACFTVKYADGAFQFTVHGFGHGVGMSQYGADYMARQGSTWQEILTHYYTGVTIE